MTALFLIAESRRCVGLGFKTGPKSNSAACTYSAVARAENASLLATLGAGAAAAAAKARDYRLLSTLTSSPCEGITRLNV